MEPLLHELDELVTDAKRAKNLQYFAAKRCGVTVMLLTVAALVINALTAAGLVGENPVTPRWLAAAAAICTGIVSVLKLGGCAADHWRVGTLYTEVYRDARMLRARFRSGKLRDDDFEKALLVLLRDYKKVNTATLASHTTYFDRWCCARAEESRSKRRYRDQPAPHGRAETT